MADVRNNQERRGTVTIEAALVFPILLLLTLALVEYGWMFLKAQQTTNAARNGARIGALAQSTTADAYAAVSSLMDTAGMSGYSVTCTPEEVGSLPPGETLKVEVTIPYANVALLGTPFVPVPENLTASVSMAKEGS